MMDTNQQPQGRVGCMAPDVLEGLESGYSTDTWSSGVVIIEEFYW